MDQPGKPQSFEDREYFPSFVDCPGEHAWDDRYFEDAHPSDPTSAVTNRKHWCLLGEIIQADTLIRPRIVAKDYKGDRFVVAFYPDDTNDMRRLLQNFKVGNTIAIFYALVHNFLDGSVGVRVEKSDRVLIIPLTFNDVIKMNEQVIAYTPVGNAPRQCHACGEVKQNLNMCARCTLFYYCNKDCQTKAWNEKDHKKFCKVLKDKNIRSMHFLNYGTYHSSSSFSQVP
ncbi:hypothetical protein F4818DRAFT_416949 [Hypoxylon cercidicola]|nr:hypothetical protein F4818DRAFT_416949 [Hypoxylon cercidicola]